jgi:ribonuclease-3
MEAVVAAVYLEAGLAPVLGLIDRFLGDAFARASAGTLDRDWKTQLQELAQSRLRSTPRYRVVAEHGPDHSKVFEVETDLRGEMVGRGAGRSKKDAEQAAARTALDHLALRFGVAPEPAPPPGPLPAAAPPPVPPGEAEPVPLAAAERQGAPTPPEPPAAPARRRRKRGPKRRPAVGSAGGKRRPARRPATRKARAGARRRKR